MFLVRQQKMKLKRFLLRYYPPGIILEYEQHGEVFTSCCSQLMHLKVSLTSQASLCHSCFLVQMRNKHIDLLDLTPETDVEVLVNQIVRSEPLISDSRKPQLRKLVYKLIEKIDTSDTTAII